MSRIERRIRSGEKNNFEKLAFSPVIFGYKSKQTCISKLYFSKIVLCTCNWQRLLRNAFGVTRSFSSTSAGKVWRLSCNFFRSFLASLDKDSSSHCFDCLKKANNSAIPKADRFLLCNKRQGYPETKTNFTTAFSFQNVFLLFNLDLWENLWKCDSQRIHSWK